MNVNSSRENPLDVAVAGAGVSGLYSAWRLLNESRRVNGGTPSIAVFEGDNRTGGRLLSVAPPGISGTRVELGGMRFTSSHTRVSGLTKFLDLPADPFPVSEPENIAYVRGKTLRRSDLLKAESLPYNLDPDERTPRALGNGFTAVAAQRIVRMVLGKDQGLGDFDWGRFANSSYEGEPLSHLPMQYLIQRCISQEAFEFAQDTSGYDSILHTWNAADGLPWNLADFGQPVQFYHLHDGFAKLPAALAERFERKGGKIEIRQWLYNFDTVELTDGTTGIEAHFSADDGTASTVTARRLILAMPRKSLELLEQSGAVLGNSEVHDLIHSVTPIPLFKLSLCYPFAWWETLEPPVTRGQSITDLPIRQVYYWAKDPDTQNAVVLIYDDGSDLRYWAGLRDRKNRRPFETRDASPGDDPALALWYEHKAPRLMVEEAHRQLLVMHGVQNRPDIPQPYAAAYRDWGEKPYGGGANFWHLHVNSMQVARDIRQPKPPVPVYVCGEAYSHNQGWVEGALETADAMLAEHFSLGEPGWLQKPVTVGR